MRHFVIAITTLLLFSCASINKVESEEDVVQDEVILIDTIYSDSYKLSPEDSVWHPFYLEQVNDSIRFTAYVNVEQKVNYTFYERFQIGRPSGISYFNLDSATLPLPEDYTISKPDIVNTTFNKSNLAFEKLNDSVLFIEHWQSDVFPSYPYMVWDEYGENIDSVDENGNTVYPPIIEGYKKSKLIHLKNHKEITTPDFTILYNGGQYNYLLSGTSISNSYIYTTDREFQVLEIDSTINGFLSKSSVLKSLIGFGGTNYQLVNPVQKYTSWEKYIPVSYLKNDQTGLYNLKNGIHWHLPSSFSIYHPEKYTGLYLKNDSLFSLNFGHRYSKKQPFSINDMDSLARSNSFGIFFRLTDTIAEHSPMHHKWIFENEKIEGTYWDHIPPLVYLIEPKIAYVHNHIIEEYQTEIDDFGEIAYNENGEVIKSGENFPGRYKSGVFDFEKNRWVIPDENIWVMYHSDKYIVKKPILNEKGLFIGANYDIYNSDFQKLKSALALNDLPEEFRQVLRKKMK